ncbi:MULTISPECIES: diaminopimelate epimerase [unclassified Microbulbifer]|uniref:diaminopimelate epimerase n=1 Tax=unclassified Microbulbifer TaxID=2619833 RepID=UPI0027E42A78|nr:MULTISPECIES: diaminopimelate epimerase [unclassified Microbulbifer]
MRFTKYHALGNDYLVVDPKDLGHEITASEVRMMCDRHYGIGADGILYGPLKSQSSDFALRIFNPDASEAEKSGNGLRIFCRYLWDSGLVGEDEFSVETKGGDVRATIHDLGHLVSIEMGEVRFSHSIEKFQSPRSETINIAGRFFEFYRASVGNPHCVILVDKLAPALAIEYGPVIENNEKFDNRTNVQFMKVIDRNKIQIEIWERGAGYTFASGSSSTAAAAVAFGLGLCGSKVSVNMPGGVIEVAFREGFSAKMKGAVCKIGEGHVADEALQAFDELRAQKTGGVGVPD